MKSCTNFQTYISIFQRMHHTFFILGFFKGKLAKNEPKLRDFQNLPKTRPKMMFMWNKCLFHHFWGYLATKSGVRFRIWASKVPFFGTRKRPILVILGQKRTPHSSSHKATHYQLIVGPLTNTLVLRLSKGNKGRGTSILAACFSPELICNPKVKYDTN